MSEDYLIESAWQRGARDFKLATKTFRFWVPEAGGTAVIGAFDGVLAAIFFFGFAFAVWLGATVSAPIKQRNEAIEEIRRLQPKGDQDWLSLPDAAAFYRDELDTTALEEDRAEYDVWGAEYGSETPYAMFFASLLRRGVNLGALKARGKPNNGNATVNISPPIYFVENASDIDAAIRGSDHRIYENIEVSKDSIRNFVKVLENEQVESQRSPEQEQD